MHSFDMFIRVSYLGNGEKANPWHKDQGHSIEPASNVGKDPQGQAKLDRIEHIFNKKETSELQKGSIQFGRSVIGNAAYFVFRDLQVEFCKRNRKLCLITFLCDIIWNHSIFLEDSGLK